MEKLPLRHIGNFETFVDGKTNRTRLVGTWARFETGSAGRTKTQLHRWCVCDESKAEKNKECATYLGHFVSTQGSSINSSAHPNQGKDGCSFVDFKPDPAKPGTGSAKGKEKPASTAATSSSSSTVADADLKRALSHIGFLNDQLRQLAASRDTEHLKYAKTTELANTQLNLQAETTNGLISAHARTLRTSQLETSNAITKIKVIHGQCEGFAENMLEKATDGLAPDLVTTADWKKAEGATKKKVPGPRSVNVFNINAFQGAEATLPPTPIQHMVFQLTDTKVNAQPTPDGCEPPVDHSNFLIPGAFASSAAAAGGKKRKRDRSGDDDSDAASSAPDEDN